jgi:hypothetical protein
VSLSPLLLLALLAPAVSAGETIEALGYRWTVPVASDWKVTATDGIPTLEILVPRPSTKPRRPSQYALADTSDYVKVTIDAELRPEPEARRNHHNSMMLVYAWRDADHFNYVHLSVDKAKAAAVHNGVFHVYGGDRVRISSEEGPESFPQEGWYKVKLVYDGTTGKVEVFVNGKSSPSLRAVDMSLGSGKVGLGSFFDMGEIRNVKITGEPPKH